jgi:hypothetical protein
LFHVAVGGLFALNKKYEWIEHIASFSNCLPAKYFLIPSTFSEIFNWLQYFDDMVGSSIDLDIKYHLYSQYEGVRAGANLYKGIVEYLALDTLSSASTGYWKLPDSLEPNAVMPYYWGMKGTDEIGNELPLFLYLHGSGPKEREWSTGLNICRNFDDAPSVYFIPQIPNEGEYYRWWQKAKQFAWEKLLRQSLLLGKIDPNRVYVFGISEGGYGSQRLASFYADYWAAAGPMAGGEPLKNAPAENCSNFAFSLRTGDKDTGFYRNTLTGYVREAFDSLAHQHPGYFTHKIELIPGMGHSIDYRPTTPWLKQYVRNPYPD